MIDSLFGSSLPSCPHLLTGGELSSDPPLILVGVKSKAVEEICFSFVFSFSSAVLPLNFPVFSSPHSVCKVGGGYSNRDGMS